MDARDSATLEIACCSFFCIVMALTILSSTKLIPDSVSPARLQQLFFARTGLWFCTVVPAVFGFIGVLWLVLHIILPQDLKSIPTIIGTLGVIAIVLGIFSLLLSIRKLKSVRSDLSVARTDLEKSLQEMKDAVMALSETQRALEQQIKNTDDLLSRSQQNTNPTSAEETRTIEIKEQRDMMAAQLEENRTAQNRLEQKVLQADGELQKVSQAQQKPHVH